MKHPIIKLFFARLRALAAAQRAAYPVWGFPHLTAPFARHAMRVEMMEGPRHVVVGVGDRVAALFGAPVVGRALADLFAPGDRGRVEAMIGAALSDRVGCVFGAVAQRSRFRAMRIEAMLTPEPIAPDGRLRASLCLVPVDRAFRSVGGPLPPLALISERFVDLDGFAAGRSALQAVRRA